MHRRRGRRCACHRAGRPAPAPPGTYRRTRWSRRARAPPGGGRRPPAPGGGGMGLPVTERGGPPGGGGMGRPRRTGGRAGRAPTAGPAVRPRPPAAGAAGGGGSGGRGRGRRCRRGAAGAGAGRGGAAGAAARPERAPLVRVGAGAAARRGRQPGPGRPALPTAGRGGGGARRGRHGGRGGDRGRRCGGAAVRLDWPCGCSDAGRLVISRAPVALDRCRGSRCRWRRRRPRPEGSRGRGRAVRSRSAPSDLGGGLLRGGGLLGRRCRLLGLHRAAEALPIGLPTGAVGLGVLDGRRVALDPHPEGQAQVERFFVGQAELVSELVDADLLRQRLLLPFIHVVDADTHIRPSILAHHGTEPSEPATGPAARPRFEGDPQRLHFCAGHRAP